jgi:hypothetical protein
MKNSVFRDKNKSLLTSDCIRTQLKTILYNIQYVTSQNNMFKKYRIFNVHSALSSPPTHRNTTYKTDSTLTNLSDRPHFKPQRRVLEVLKWPNFCCSSCIHLIKNIDQIKIRLLETQNQKVEGTSFLVRISSHHESQSTK